MGLSSVNVFGAVDSARKGCALLRCDSSNNRKEEQSQWNNKGSWVLSLAACDLQHASPANGIIF
jgi:hypothetical protein